MKKFSAYICLTVLLSSLSLLASSAHADDAAAPVAAPAAAPSEPVRASKKHHTVHAPKKQAHHASKAKKHSHHKAAGHKAKKVRGPSHKVKSPKGHSKTHKPENNAPAKLPAQPAGEPLPEPNVTN